MSGSAGQSGNIKFGIVVFALLIGALAWHFSLRTHHSQIAETPRANPAVERVMNTYNALVEKYQNLPRDITPAQYAAVLGELCDVLQRQDMSGCPRNFRVACEQNSRALRDAQRAVEQYPEGFMEAVATGALNYWIRGEKDGGVTRLRDEVKTALDRVRATSDEVERIAANYMD